MKTMRGNLCRRLLAGALVFCSAAAVQGQFAVRPDDPLGLSIRENRVRIIHSKTPEVPGTSMHLQQYDPWLAYQRGRSYYFREWGVRDAVFSKLPDRPEAASATSCGVCHNSPFPSVGSGGNVGIEMRVGRNAPHFFGGGLLETLGLQIRAQVLHQFDTNRNGFLDVPEETAGKRVIVTPRPGVELDFGSLEDADGNGRPDLNPMFLIRMVNENGERVLYHEGGPRAKLTDPGIVGYDVAMGVFSSSAGDHQFPSMRTFSTGVFVTIMGILPEGQTKPLHPKGFRPGYFLHDWGKLSNAGAFRSEVMMTGDPFEDPDRANRPTITEGEMDMLDWFMLNHPAPAVGPQNAKTRRGKVLMREMGCVECHVESWEILPADDEIGLPGDRRFFNLTVSHEPSRGGLEGKLEPLTKTAEGPNGERFEVPRREGFTVDDVYTDLRHHDLGNRFWEYTFWKGKLYATTREFKTPALWGVGSTAPYGHDGRSPTLDDVIRRHGRAAKESRDAYVAAPAEDRQAVIAFLRSLVLYQPENLPTDLNGDGKIETAYKVEERDLGPELFRAELNFRVKPRYRGWTQGPDGDRFFSYELLNVPEAYGEQLEALKDTDGDTLPDLLDKADDTDREEAAAGR